MPSELTFDLGYDHNMRLRLGLWQSWTPKAFEAAAFGSWCYSGLPTEASAKVGAWRLVIWSFTISVSLLVHHNFSEGGWQKSGRSINPMSPGFTISKTG